MELWEAVLVDQLTENALAALLESLQALSEEISAGNTLFILTTREQKVPLWRLAEQRGASEMEWITPEEELPELAVSAKAVRILRLSWRS